MPPKATYPFRKVNPVVIGKRYKIRMSPYFYKKYGDYSPVITIEGEDMDVFGESWKVLKNSPPALAYGMRVYNEGLPTKGKVFHGRIENSIEEYGEFVHISELRYVRQWWKEPTEEEKLNKKEQYLKKWREIIEKRNRERRVAVIKQWQKKRYFVNISDSPIEGWGKDRIQAIDNLMGNKNKKCLINVVPPDQSVLTGTHKIDESVVALMAEIKKYWRLSVHRKTTIFHIVHPNSVLVYRLVSAIGRITRICTIITSSELHQDDDIKFMGFIEFKQPRKGGVK